MKIGVKTYYDEKFLDFFKDKADFFEIQGLRNKNYDFMKKYELSVVVHAEHSNQGSNPADINNYKTNIESLNRAIEVSNFVNGDVIIFHPGIIRNKSSNKDNALKFIKNIKDKRIHLENLPEKNYRQLCTTPKEMREFMQKTNKKFNFDLAHALVTANRLKMNRMKIVRDFLKLKPSHFHISGQMLDSDYDQHLALTEGNIDYEEILSLYPRDAHISLEVTTDINKTEKDLKFIRKIINKLV